MPLYEYHCRSGHLIEKLRKYERRFDEVVCECGQQASIVVSMPAKMAYQWGDTKWDGRYDRGLGVKLRDKKHREQVMKAKGLRPLEDGEVEAEQRRVSREHDAHNAQVKKYQQVLKDTGSTAKAMAETFPDTGV